MSDSQVSIGAALSYAWSLWRAHWREIWGALALNALACTVFFAGVFTGDGNITAAGSAGLLVITLTVNGTMMRLAFAGEHTGDPEFQLGALGLQWRRMEARLFLANLLLTLLMSLVFVVCAGLATVVLMGVFAAKIPAHLPTAAMTRNYGAQLLGRDPIVAALMVIGAILMFVLVRVTLYVPATADTGKVQLLKTWPLTRGRFWQIFATTLIIWLPSILTMVFGSGAGLSLDGAPAPLAPGETFIYSLICGGWAGAAAMPLAAGVQAYFYRNLKTVG